MAGGGGGIVGDDFDVVFNLLSFSSLYSLSSSLAVGASVDASVGTSVGDTGCLFVQLLATAMNLGMEMDTVKSVFSKSILCRNAKNAKIFSTFFHFLRSFLSK